MPPQLDWQSCVTLGAVKHRKSNTLKRKHFDPNGQTKRRILTAKLRGDLWFGDDSYAFLACGGRFWTTVTHFWSADARFRSERGEGVPGPPPRTLALTTNNCAKW